VAAPPGRAGDEHLLVAVVGGVGPVRGEHDRARVVPHLHPADLLLIEAPGQQRGPQEHRGDRLGDEHRHRLQVALEEVLADRADVGVPDVGQPGDHVLRDLQPGHDPLERLVVPLDEHGVEAAPDVDELDAVLGELARPPDDQRDDLARGVRVADRVGQREGQLLLERVDVGLGLRAVRVVGALEAQLVGDVEQPGRQPGADRGADQPVDQQQLAALAEHAVHRGVGVVGELRVHPPDPGDERVFGQVVHEVAALVAADHHADLVVLLEADLAGGPDRPLVVAADDVALPRHQQVEQHRPDEGRLPAAPVVQLVQLVARGGDQRAVDVPDVADRRGMVAAVVGVPGVEPDARADRREVVVGRLDLADGVVVPPGEHLPLVHPALAERLDLLAAVDVDSPRGTDDGIGDRIR
jgi:hypothetical protein